MAAAATVLPCFYCGTTANERIFFCLKLEEGKRMVVVAPMSTADTRSDGKLPSRSEEYAREVGERIVIARKEQALTQVELAELAGVSQRSMQAYENGEVVPYRKMREIARILEKPVEYLLYGEGLFTAPDERLESIERSLEKLSRSIDALARKIK